MQFQFQTSLSTKELDSYSAAANVAEEVLSGIRTVFAFGGEKLEIERYNKRLINAKKAVKVKGLLSGLGDGIMRFLFFGSNALAFWYGVKLVLEDRNKVDKEYTPAVLMITFFGLISGAENIAKTAPFLESFAAACGSAAGIFRVIDRTSKIDSMSNEGKVPNFGIQGNIAFKNIQFSYPSRPDVQVKSFFYFTQQKNNPKTLFYAKNDLLSSIDSAWSGFRNSSRSICCARRQFRKWQIHLLAIVAAILRP